MYKEGINKLNLMKIKQHRVISIYTILTFKFQYNNYLFIYFNLLGNY